MNSIEWISHLVLNGVLPIHEACERIKALPKAAAGTGKAWKVSHLPKLSLTPKARSHEKTLKDRARHKKNYAQRKELDGRFRKTEVAA